MPEAKPSADVDESGDEHADAVDDVLGSQRAPAVELEALKTRGDIAGLLALAKACRAGTTPNGRDLKSCLEAYRAAAELGSADAEYAVALFCMSGGVVTQDLKEGATRLRAAAEKGSVPAKVYIGNLYQLGIHYKADTEKADVWYRNAARGAGVGDDPASPEYARALAELGCARHVIALAESEDVDADERARLLQRARAHGYGLRLRDDAAMDRPTFLNALQDAETAGLTTADTRDAPPRDLPAAPKGEKSRPDAATSSKKEAGAAAKPKTVWRSAASGAAFGYALLFVATGIGAGYAATLGARELVSHGQVLPGLGTRTDLVFPIVLALVGILPTCLVYRFGAVLKALVVAAAFAGVGWIAWGTGQAALHAERPVQALAFALAGFLPALLVLGLLGGAKQKPPPRRRHLSG